MMAGRRKNLLKARPDAPKVKDITLEQYTRGWEVFSTSGSVPEVLAATNMTRKQFEYLLSNPLPCAPDEHPSYYARFAEIATEMRLNAVEASQIISKGGVRNLRNRDKIATMAEVLAFEIVNRRTKEVVSTSKLGPDDPGWKPIHKQLFTNSELSTLRVLKDWADYSRNAETFERLYERLGSTMRMPKGTKLDFDIDPESVLPAVVSTQAAVAEARKQEDQEYHQQLFRDFENWTEEDLEAYMDGRMPEVEKFKAGEDMDG